MTPATVTADGQVVLPADVRHALHVGPGDRVLFVEVDAGRYEVIAATRSVKELKGLFPRPATPVSIERMNQVIAERGGSVP